MTLFEFRSTNRAFVRRIVSASFLSLACLGGCSSGGPSDIDPAWKLDEHGNPDFKPKNFEDAMADSKVRYGELATIPQAETSPEARKFRQIVRWLPEFAADTPIRRAGWEELKSRTERMEAAARKPGFFAQDRAEAFEQEMKSISALVPPDTLYRKLDAREEPAQAGESEANETSSVSNVAEVENSAPIPKGEER
jgi:hypothetical protein